MKHACDLAVLTITMVIFGLLAICTFVPILFVFMTSVDSRGYLGPMPPPNVSLRWFQSFFFSSYYIQGAWTTIIVGTFSALLASMIGTAAGIGLTALDNRASRVLSALFLSPLVVPNVVLGFGLLLAFSRLGIGASVTRLVLAHLLITLPYTIRMILAALAGIPPSMYESGLSLGAKPLAVVLEIILPLIRAAVVAGFVVALAFSVDEVSMTIFLTAPNTYTLPIALISNMKGSFDLTISAASVIIIAATAMIVLILQLVVGLERIVGYGVSGRR